VLIVHKKTAPDDPHPQEAAFIQLGAEFGQALCELTSRRLNTLGDLMAPCGCQGDFDLPADLSLVPLAPQPAAADAYVYAWNRATSCWHTQVWNSGLGIAAGELDPVADYYAPWRCNHAYFGSMHADPALRCVTGWIRLTAFENAEGVRLLAASELQGARLEKSCENYRLASSELARIAFSLTDGKQQSVLARKAAVDQALLAAEQPSKRLPDVTIAAHKHRLLALIPAAAFVAKRMNCAAMLIPFGDINNKSPWYRRAAAMIRNAGSLPLPIGDLDCFYVNCAQVWAEVSALTPHDPAHAGCLVLSGGDPRAYARKISQHKAIRSPASSSNTPSTEPCIL
jgi:hypothetical protein